MITKLTAEQEAKLAAYRDKWLEIGLSCEPLDEQGAKRAIIAAYKIQHRHNELHYDDDGRLHNESDMAIKYRDGFGVYMWHGMRIPNEYSWIITDPERLNSVEIDAEQNQEIKRVMVERYGMAEYLLETGAEIVDEHIDYKLIRQHNDNFIDGERAVLLQCVDTSTARTYHLRVPPATKSCWEAVAWTFGMSAEEYQPIAES